MTHAPRDWFAERDRGEDEHPIDEEVRQRLGASLVEMDARILDLKKRVTDSIGTNDVWLELEALLNDRASLREAAYYNAGVDHGRTHGALEELLGDQQSADPQGALHTLAELGSMVALLARRAARALYGRPRVLLVEDDPLLARSLDRTLSEHMDVRAASSAEQALVALREEDFDLILTDLQLGGRDGLWLLGEARRIRPAARRVLMSASDVDADELTASGVAHAFVPKADVPTALMPTLMRVLALPR